MTGLVTKPVLTREHYFVAPQFATQEGGRCARLCVVQHARESAYCNIIAIILTINALHVYQRSRQRTEAY